MPQTAYRTPPVFATAVLRFCFTPRAATTLCVINLGLGVVYALAALPLPMVLGYGRFWEFPRGTIGGAGGGADMADPLVGYLYLMQSPWTLPLLKVANLGAPQGTNIFWLDCIPWLCLLGKAIFSCTGIAINLFGLFIFACFVLPGVAMTALLAVCGQRHLCAALAATCLAEATPFLWYRWGQTALLAQFVLIVAWCLYCATTRWPGARRIAWTWLLLLAFTLLTNVYLLAMTLTIWGVSFLQKCRSRQAPIRALVAEPLAIAVVIACLMLLTGMLTPDLTSESNGDFGAYPMNLASAFIPQMSGVIPGLSAYQVGLEYEGFAYLGLGTLLLLACALPGSWVWLRRNANHHIFAIALLVLLFLFAVSNQVHLGSHLLLSIPLPAWLDRILATFRSSGRFFWPVGYALMAFGLLQVLRNFRPGIALGILVIAAIVQLIDVGPLRALVAASAATPRAAVIDRQQTAGFIRESRAVMVFPTFGCVVKAMDGGARPVLPADELLALTSRDPFSSPRVAPASRVVVAQRELLLQANMELMLIAARANVPVNTVYNARLSTDCAAEQRTMREELRPGVAYFYLAGVPPAAQRLPGSVCRQREWFVRCLIPDRGSH